MKRTKMALSLFVALAMFAASCGSDSSSDNATADTTDTTEATDTTEGDAAASTEAPATTAADLPTEDVTLEVWSWLPNDHDNGPDTYDAIFASFEEQYPNVTIDLTAMPYPTFWDTWRTATIAGTGPDVVSMYGGATAVAYADSLVPLQDGLGAETLDDLRFVGSSYSPDGNLYAVPAGAYAYYLLVNQNILTEAGLDPATAFADWDSLLASCTTLADAGITPIASGWSDGFIVENYLYVFMSQLLDEDSFDQWVTGQLDLSDPRFADALNYILTMEETGCFSEASVGMTLYYDAFDEAVSGDAAAVVTGDAFTALDAESNNGEGSMTAMVFPQLPESQYDNVSDSGPNQGWSVASWSENIELSTLLVEHIVSAESQELLWENTQLPPNRNSVEITADSDLFNEYLSIINNDENHTVFMAFTDPALAIFQREASNLITGRTDPADVLAEADEAQIRALQELEG